MSPPTASHQRRKAERPQELLDAALRLFVEKGFAATRTDEVARLAGVSKGTLYLYYTSKEDLLKAVISHHLSSKISDGAQAVAEHSGTCAQVLVELLSHWWSDLYDSDASGVFKLIITEVCNFPELSEFYNREVVAPGSQLIGSVVQRGIDSGEFRDLDVHTVVNSLVMPLIMLCIHRHSLGACALDAMPDPKAFIRQHIELVLHGMLDRDRASPVTFLPTPHPPAR